MIFGRQHFVSMVAEGYDEIITMEWRPNRLGRLLGFTHELRQYRGSCTVWSFYPEGGRCGTLLDGWLHDIWEREGASRDMEPHRASGPSPTPPRVVSHPQRWLPTYSPSGRQNTGGRPES